MKLHQGAGVVPPDLKEVTRTAGEAPVREGASQASGKPVPFRIIRHLNPSSKRARSRSRRFWLAIRAVGGDGGISRLGFGSPSGKMTERTWHRDQIHNLETKQSRIGFLKSENAAGKEIYVRPAPLSGGDLKGWCWWTISTR